ncbi:TetR/AcrR family transcriptional regulator [Brachybacterium paraconglomeratum]|uniref:TetR/AcrR family transcriptional regulator n=1 Tax=Brachybacterium paraconglomeratum TaxID=173362 RepID=UPI0021A7D13E|nr:TetR/AcrR family transcriptional regulator [Brachybacterium paraconglomeratum]MCT1908399.1 TetR/AcrR family transcriptional regulator [Brachybacterium paraconglomeratum]
MQEAPWCPHAPPSPSPRTDAAEAHLSEGGTLTLDSAARAAGVTKPGLMYHFSTKEQLLGAILDRMTARYEREMLALVAARHGAEIEDFAEAPAEHRVLAYLDWACTGAIDAADLVIFADPHLRVTLTERWEDQLSRWLGLPAGVDAGRGARLLAVRLMADGLWFDRASGLDVGSEGQLDQARELARDLLGGGA